jgi:acyl-CoA dehydrogenase
VDQGAPDPRCEILILMGKTDPATTHRQQSMILVPRSHARA